MKAKGSIEKSVYAGEQSLTTEGALLATPGNNPACTEESSPRSVLLLF